MNFTTNRTIDGAPAIQQGSGVPPAFHPQVVRSVRMHPMLAAAVGGFVFLALLGYGLSRKPTYKAESQVFEEPAAAKLLSDGTTGSFDGSRYDSYLDQQKQILIRPDVLSAAIANLPEPVWRQLGPNHEAAVASLQAQLKADRIKTSYQLAIDLTMSDPAAAAAIVNAATKSYLDAVHKESAAQSDQRALLLAEERSRIETELDSTRREQAGLSASLGVASPVGETANPYDFEIAGVRQQLLTARQAHDVAGAQLNSISGDTALTNAADEAILGDPSLASMRATVSARRATLNEQMAGMKPENPVYKQDLDELADLDKTLDTMTKQLRSKAERQLQEKLRTDLERTGDIESRMNAQLARLTSTATTAAPKLQRAAELAADLTRLNTRYAAVDDALRSLQLEANGPGVVRLSLAASVPTTPEPSRKLLLLAAAPIFGAIFGIAAAVFARKRDRHIYSPRDVEDILGFAPMAVLPAKDDVSPRVMEEYVLRLAAGLEGAYRGNGAQTFLLTAASPTTDIRPLRKALTSKLERIGLDVSVASTTDLLLADTETSADAGRQIARPGDGAGFVSAHLAKLKGAHALVIINAPPLGTSAETEYVARCADATILIAESGVTTHEELYESARLLQRLDARGVGAVLQGLQLRLAGESFRHAVDAVEQRQPDLYNSTVRTRPVDVEEPEEISEIEYVKPRQRPLADVVVPFSKTQLTNEEPLVEITPEAAEETVSQPIIVLAPAIVEDAAEPVPVAQIVEPVQVAEVLAATALVEELPQVTEESARSRPPAILHEKMSPMLSGPREPESDGVPTMSGSKNWFQRLLHRDDEKVSIIPDHEDDDQPTDEASFLTSRISRAVPAYQALAPKEELKFEATTALPVVRRAVLEDLQPIQEEQQLKPEVEDVPVVVAAEIAHEVVETPFEPVALPEPNEITPEPMVSAVEVPAVVEGLSLTNLVSHPQSRPARPLSFHELVARAEQSEVSAAAEPSMETHEPVASEAVAAEAEMMQAVELPSELLATHEEVAHDEEAPGKIHSAELATEESVSQAPALEEPVIEAVEPVEAVAEEPVAQAEEVVTKTESMSPAQVEQTGSITKEFARITSTFTPNGTSRWDPIPPLRPTDSGWKRVHAINEGTGSNGSEYAGVERRRNGDLSGDQLKPSRDNEAPSDIEFGAQRWAEQAAAAETDEPALSRPWGLLSRFQQAHMITPARRNGTTKGSSSNGNGTTNGASGNGSGAKDHDRELEPEPARSDRNG